MTSDKYWEKLLKKTPQLQNLEGKMTMKIVAFKAQIMAAYAQGRADEIDKPRNNDKSNGVFDDIFGKGLF